MRKILPLVFALCLIAAACGDGGSDGGDTNASSRSTTSEAGNGGGTSGSASSMAKAAGLTGKTNDHGQGKVADGKSIEVEMDDTYFEPTFIEAPAGATFTVELANEGDMPHTFTVDSLDIDEQLDPGDKTEVEVTMPSSSTGFHCNFLAQMGMQGGLIVAGAGGSGSTMGQDETDTSTSTSTSTSTTASGYGY